MNEAILSCQHVWKLYGPDPKAYLQSRDAPPSLDEIKGTGFIPAVRNATFDVHAGEILIIMGLSGSGKSTLVRCLSRLVDPTAGEIFFEGRDLLNASPKELIDIRRHKMGMVFQHFALLPNRTVLENVAFPLEVQGVGRANRETRAREMIELVGLDGREKYYPRELSGGQQQRVGIARSLAVEPDVWFLDEPFSALDPLIRREMQDEFLRLQSMLKKTIVFITHDFDEAIRLADRVAIMFEGGIDQLGTPEEIITSPATDYVAEFTKDIPRDKLLTVGSLMEAVDSMEMVGEGLRHDEKLHDVAHAILTSSGPNRVVDEQGNTIGAIRRSRVLDTLFGEGN
ncbi:MAG: betaine/proline/choline family ABC transporter ATP-binding protein [Hyphomicrobiaceae bacterium]